MSTPRVLILAGGFGTRLASVVSDRPKPMAPIQGRPLLEYQIEYLKNQGFARFTLLTGHMSEVIEQHFGDGSRFGVAIDYSVETEPLGTGGAIRLAMEKSQEDLFLVLNGDGLFATDYRRLLRLASGPVTLALKFASDLSRFGAVEIDRAYAITHFLEKSNALGDGYLNAGAYVIERAALAHMPVGKFSLETQVFEPLSQKRVLLGIPCGGKFIDIGTPESFEWSQANLPQWMQERFRPCLFLDRDGVLIRHVPYMHTIDKIELIAETVELIKKAHVAGWWCIAITNQAGVARGYFKPADCEKVRQEIDRRLNDLGVKIDHWFTCFNHPEGAVEPYKRSCLRRKPAPGMLLEACEAVPIDLSRSLMLGDNVSDQIQLPDLKTYLVEGDFKIDRVVQGNQVFSSFKDLALAVEKTIAESGATK